MRILAVNVLESIGLAWLQYREFRRVLAELESYSDRELASDLRIDRADFVRIAYEAAEQHVARYQAERARTASRPRGYAALFRTVGAPYDPFRPQPRLS
jgi:uncharacterized protein YjiS (DUF1127 family)